MSETKATAQRRQWDVWFEEAERDGKFCKEAIVAADWWTTCMCGSQEEAIPREIDDGRYGAPEDDDLYFLGLEFAEAVKAHDVRRARFVGARIDARAVVVLRALAEGRGSQGDGK